MSRLVCRPISICTWQDNRPLAYSDKDQIHFITNWIDEWSECGEWWSGCGERLLFRVLTADGTVADLEQTEDQWTLYRLWD